jgi:hypothetical protein
MQNDPLQEWQRLSDVYRGMYDDELLNLAADAQDLTETARQVLESEMKKRGLALQRDPQGKLLPPDPMQERRADLRTDRGAPPRHVPDDAGMMDETDEPGGPAEYTWKTRLCECETKEQAQQISEALKLAGIDCWIEYQGASFTGVWDQIGVGKLQLLVPADQLSQAREIAMGPIPQGIIDQSKSEVPEFEPPVCPKCGAPDPILEGVDPFNTWKCEACGNEWTESAEDLTLPENS